MTGIWFSRRDFEYDVHSLVKAFYLKEDVTIITDETPSDIRLKISVFYEEKQIRIRFEHILPGSGADMEEKTEIDSWENRTETKNRLKRLLYGMLTRETGMTLPWGDLTGIRPTKIAMGLVKSGMDEEQVKGHMEKTYFVSPEKASLAYRIAARENCILRNIDYRRGYSLYVGIPFCPSICLYCSFSSSPISAWQDKSEDYLAALMKEIDGCAHLYDGFHLDTFYMGGGTPTTLSPDQLDRLLGHLEKRFDLEGTYERTVEAGRPDSITEEKLAVLRSHGISRISINPQTMNQKTLDIIGRRHTVDQIREAYALARRMGFDNINMDLIVGLPGEGPEEVAATMREIRAMDPDSVTVHSLALKRGTRLHLFKDEYEDISFRNSEAIMDETAASCAMNGLLPYYLYRQKNMAGNFENVGYAREGKEGLYNILIMEEVESILAFGAGASTKMVLGEDGSRIERIENVKDIRSYLSRIDEMIERKQRIRDEYAKYGQ